MHCTTLADIACAFRSCQWPRQHQHTTAGYLENAVTTCSWLVNNLLQVYMIVSALGAVDRGVT